MGRLGKGRGDDEQMLRTMLSVGITEDLQISGSLPITLDSSIYMTSGRAMAMMSSNQDFEAILGWRFQRRAVGRRGAARIDRLRRRRGAAAGVSPGRHAGRAIGLRVGGDRLRVASPLPLGGRRLPVLRRAAGRSNGRHGFLQRRVRVSSAVSARRLSEAGSAVLRRSRRRAHGTGASTTASSTSSAAAMRCSSARRRSCSTSSTDSKPGLLFPVYQQTNFQPDEKFRFGVNFTYFFWRK